MKQAILGVLVAAGIIAIPALGLAASYQYVDMQGELESVTANTAEEAMMKASDIAPRSGVILVTPSTDLPDDMEVAL